MDDTSKMDVAENYVKTIAEKILRKYSTKFIAVSVFTYQCQTFSEMFAQNIKAMDPNISLIFGGQGIMTQGINASDGWVKKLRQRKVIDHYIVSEGERAMIDLLQTG